MFVQRRALSQTAARGKGLLFGGDGASWIGKSMKAVLWQNKNGNIRYRRYNAQFTDLRLSGNTMLAISGSWMMFSVCFNILSDFFFMTPFHAFPGNQAKNLRKLGVTPNLEDHSYGSWNYYPTDHKRHTNALLYRDCQ